jgi:hypothetical protein
MTTTANAANLGAASIAAERALFGPPGWTVVASASNDALVANQAGVTNKQHWLTHLTLSFSAAPAAPTTLTVKDGSTVIWQVEISITTIVLTENFETRPLHATTGAALTVNVGAGGSGVVGTISASGFTTAGP